MNLYTCPKCKVDNLLLNEVLLCPTGNYIHSCKKCWSDKWKQFRKTEEGQRYTRNKTFKYKYGITIDQYEQMLLDQGNQCQICSRNFDVVKPDIDHCHKTKKVRGILCHSCNLALGYLRENEEIVLNVLSYLKKHRV